MDTTANESQLDATAVNTFSKVLTATLHQITCPVHERCDGSCQPDGPIRFEAPRYGEMSFDFQISRKTETSTLPLEPIPIHLPTETFQYSAIDSENGQIRLLRVQPAVFLADPVIVELIDARLESSPDYTALSYHWGPPLFDHSIICNGKALHVNKSLHDALQRQRQEVMCVSDRSDLLWADAICINQKDTEELNEQVLLMRQIYHKAERVVVDLGDVPLEWYFAFDLMKRVEMVKEAINPNSSKWQFSIPLPPEIYGLPPFDHGVWSMYFHIFSSPWFFRTWIIQEVSLARAIFVRAGRYAFKLEVLGGTYEFLYNNEDEHKILGDTEASVGFLNLQKILAVRDHFRQGILTPIKLLDLARDFKVSNPKDKIIGLIGLLSQGESVFRPDYSWSETKLFHQFATYIIGNLLQPRPWGSEERKSLLSHAGLQRQPDGCSLPSWAPDWTAQSRDGPKALSTIRKRPYAAATPSATVPDQRADNFQGPAAGLFIVDDEPGLLCVLSLRVDTIAAISSSYLPREPENRDAYHQWKVWHSDALTVLRDAAIKGEFQYPDSEAAFSRTLLADDTYSGIDAMRQFPPIDNPSTARLGAVASTGTSLDPAVATYQMQAATACQSRRFAATSNGYIGLVPACSEIGDIVYLFSGFSIPFVLRGRPNGHFVLVGDAYVHGIMEGEFWKNGNFKWPHDWAPVMLC